jgi:hypothetical protein
VRELGFKPLLSNSTTCFATQREHTARGGFVAGLSAWRSCFGARVRHPGENHEQGGGGKGCGGWDGDKSVCHQQRDVQAHRARADTPRAAAVHQRAEHHRDVPHGPRGLQGAAAQRPVVQLRGFQARVGGGTFHLVTLQSRLGLFSPRYFAVKTPLDDSQYDDTN